MPARASTRPRCACASTGPNDRSSTEPAGSGSHWPASATAGTRSMSPSRTSRRRRTWRTSRSSYRTRVCSRRASSFPKSRSPLPVGLFDRRQLVEVALDARGELLGLRAQELELALALRSLTPPPCLVAEPGRKPRPLSSDHGRNGAGKEGDHQPAHADHSSYVPALNPHPLRADTGAYDRPDARSVHGPLGLVATRTARAGPHCTPALRTVRAQAGTKLPRRKHLPLPLAFSVESFAFARLEGHRFAENARGRSPRAPRGFGDRRGPRAVVASPSPPT